MLSSVFITHNNSFWDFENKNDFFFFFLGLWTTEDVDEVKKEGGDFYLQ